ncbi:helix-turn-helix transcriptional regulator [Flavobacterium sp.]|uniref:helix-turn-helix domain-containing protein n=1 Tax=Flavobacterium sp. TaxID=239 RepID=UPI002625F5C0|nr:helix-turn-helix transcriptional regulator [Flavobacterium sp.]
MVNTEEFIKRLEYLLEYYHVSASAFADKLGIQRSGLSHLLSGRNKPSLDFVLKVIETFPEVDLYWLLNGKGSFPKDENNNSIIASSPTVVKTTKDLFSQEEPEALSASGTIKQEEKTSHISSGEEEIERIVVFYTNGTFKSYTHRN